MSEAMYLSTYPRLSVELRNLAAAAHAATLSNADRVKQLDELGQLAAATRYFVHSYCRIEDPRLDTDDEILNWTFGEVPDDLNAAHWNIACGFYKTAASCLRSALGMAAVALYFQIEQNKSPGQNPYESGFAEWDSGEVGTPGWRAIKPRLESLATIVAFNAAHSSDVVNELHDFYNRLCNYTHARP